MPSYTESRHIHIYKHNEYQGETFKEISIGWCEIKCIEAMTSALDR